MADICMLRNGRWGSAVGDDTNIGEFKHKEVCGLVRVACLCRDSGTVVFVCTCVSGHGGFYKRPLPGEGLVRNGKLGRFAAPFPIAMLIFITICFSYLILPNQNANRESPGILGL